MKVGIAASMWRGLADMPFPEYVEYCRDADADVIELSGWPDSYSRTLALDDAGIEQVRALTGRAGIDVCAVGCPSELVQPTPEGQAEQVALIKRYVDVAVALGAPVVGIKAGNPLDGMSVGEAQALMIQVLQQAAPYAHERTTFLAVENGGKVTSDHTRLLAVVHGTRDLYVRALLDVGNFRRDGYSPSEVLAVVEEVAPVSAHVHLKDGLGQRPDFKAVPLGEGDIDMERVMRAIKVSGYLYPLCTQYEGPAQREVYARDVAWVKARAGGWEREPGSGLVRGLHHVSLSSTTFENAYRFYGELLGLPIRPAQGISYSAVLFFELPTGEELHTHLHGPSQRMHVAIEVSDFDETVRRLKAAGIEVRGPDRRGDGSDFLFCQDFDGNGIEITHHRTWAPHRLVARG
jgi:sugar phosphate isomerase/epimerase/catechol 2,3-dioxygenase-like lactoylglutathione lyase family enzyme